MLAVDPERSEAKPPEITSTVGASRDRINGRHASDSINGRGTRSLRVVRAREATDEGRHPTGLFMIHVVTL
jgi:hypothetical protein